RRFPRAHRKKPAIPGTVYAAVIQKLQARRERPRTAAEQPLPKAKRQGRADTDDDEEIQWRAHKATLAALDEHIADTRSELKRMGSYSLKASGGCDTMTYARAWADQ